MADGVVKAIARGKLFDGKVECYVLDDERRVVGVGGIVRAIGAAEKTGLGRYLARLPVRFAGLALRPTLAVSLPEGGIAQCYEARFLVEVCRGYVESLAAGELDSRQERLAIASATILSATSEVGIVALIDEATAYQAQRASDDLQRLFARVLRKEAADWTCRWRPSLVDALCKLYGHPRPDASRIPQWLSSPMALIYRIVLGDEVTGKLRELNPEPRFGSNHHQFLQDPIQELLDDDLATVELLAAQSANPEEWKKRLLYHYRKEPLQLGFGGRA